MRRRILIGLAAFLVLAGIAHGVLQRVSTDPLRKRIEARLTETLGTAVKIGELRMALLPTPHLKARQVRVAHLPGRTAHDLLEIEQLEIGIVLWRLVERTIAIDRLAIVDAQLYLETGAQGNLGLPDLLDTEANASDETGSDHSLRIDVRAFEAKALHVDYRDGPEGALHSLMLDSVSMRSEGFASELQLDVHGRFDGSPVSLSGRIGSLRELIEPTQPFAVDLEGRLFEARVRARGSVRTPRDLEGLDLELEATIPKLVVKNHPLPEFGEIRFRGHLSDLDGTIGLESLGLSASKTHPVQFDVQGKIDDLIHLKDVALTGTWTSGSLAFLRPLIEARVDFPLPTIMRSKLEARVSDHAGSLDLHARLDVATAKDEIVLRGEGGISDLRSNPKLDFQLDASAKDLATITAFLPDVPAHGPMGAVTATSRLKMHQGVIAAQDIEVHFGMRNKVWADLEGSIADVMAMRGVDLELVFGAASLHLLKEILARDLPKTTPLEGAVGIRDDAGSLRLKHAKLHGGEKSPIEIHLDARFDDLPGPDDISVQLELRGNDTRVLGAIAGLDLPVISPVDFRATIEGTEESIRSRNLRLLLGQSAFSGDLAVQDAVQEKPGERPSLTARITSKSVRLQDLGFDPEPDETQAAASSPATAMDLHATLPFERLREIDLDLGLQLDHVGGFTGFDADDMRFMLRLNDGNLVISDAGADYQGGHLEFDLQADARTPKPKLRIGLDSQNLNLARIVSQFREDSPYSGIIDAHLELTAEGTTLDTLRKTLEGRVGAAVRDGNAASRIAQEFVFDLASIAFRGLHLAKTPKIGCGIAELEIQNGVAKVRKLLVREQQISVKGTGTIDLVTATYDLRIVPKSRNPGILSVAPEVNLTGPLDHPEFHAVKRTLVTSFGQGLIRNVLRVPATLLYPFPSRSDGTTNPDEACRLVRPSASPPVPPLAG